MATSSPVAVSVKLEDGVESDELNENVSTNHVKPSAGRQAAGEAASHSPQNVLPAASLNESFLVAVPPDKAVLASYPPGCPVLHINFNDNPPLVTFGVVQSVSIDLTSRLFVYRVSATATGNTFVSPESQLQWAPSCRVWACLSSNVTDQSVWKPCIVLTAYQPSPQSPPLFSLQDDGPSGPGALFHGIPKQYIQYRPVDSGAPPGEEPAVGFVPPMVNEGPNPNVPAPGFVPQGRPVVNENSASSASAERFVPQGRVLYKEPASRASAERFVPQGPVMNEEPASRASRRLSLVSNYSTQSRGSETMATRFKPAATRPSDTEIERPSVKRVKTNEGLPSPMGSAGNNEQDSTPLGTVVQFPASSEQAVDRELSARRGSKTQATAAEEEYANDETSDEEVLVTVDFVIPSCVFDAQAMKDFVRVNRGKIKRETECEIDLKFRGQMGMYLELTGTSEQLTAAQHAVERYLIALVDAKGRGRALYYLALVNKYRSRSGNIVFQYCYHRDKPGMKHMLHQKLPKDCNEIIGLVIGKRGSRKKNLENETNCKIEINSDYDKPHFVIYGDTDTDVRECRLRMNELMEQARVLAQKRPGRLR